ncbi:MAG: HlyD family efflux transporter periplasmic adaptor subunit [Anaerolineae bacterium]|nr:HlyD family efflux transporter periplasmic adaptor subunit [Anaerolineae bacterium]
MNQKLFTLILLSVFLMSACGALPGSTVDTTLKASGVIEATEISIAPELAGRIVDISVAEGDSVKAGDVLFRLDDTLLKSQRAAAEAALNTAQKGVASAQVAVDSAQLQYQTTLDAALAAAQADRIANWKESKPSEFDLPTWYFSENERYQSTQTEADVAKTALDKAQTNLESIERKVGSAQFVEAEKQLSDARIAFQQAKDLLDQTSGGSDTQTLRDAAQNLYDDAKTELDDAQKAYDDALTTEGAKDVLDARAKAIVAQERYDRARDVQRALQTGLRAPEVQAAVKVVEQAQANLEQAKAAIDQAQAELDLIDVQIAKEVVTAPLDGVVLTRSVEPGEVLQAGMTALTIGKLDVLRVTVYIPENRYGEVKLGDTVSLSVDSFPGQTFSATVTRIADQAEFTPRNVQTQEERQTTVYAVELSVENPDGKLKPGMPVDVIFGK